MQQTSASMTGCAERSICSDDLQTSEKMNGESIATEFSDESGVRGNEAQITVQITSQNMAGSCLEEVPQVQ